MLLICEMILRGYEVNQDNFNTYFDNDTRYLPEKLIFKEKMTNRYLKQCLYNLQEKHDYGGISDEEWKVITDHFDID